MEEKTRHVKRIAVIGSGVSGLIAARFLLKEGFDCEVFEKNDLLGGVTPSGFKNPALLMISRTFPCLKRIQHFLQGSKFKLI